MTTTTGSADSVQCNVRAGSLGTGSLMGTVSKSRARIAYELSHPKVPSYELSNDQGPHDTLPPDGEACFSPRESSKVKIRVSSTSSACGAPRIAPPKVWRLGLDVDRANLPSVTHATHFARSRAFPPSGPPRSHMPAIDFGTLLAVERDRRRRGDPRVGGGTLLLLGTGRSTRAARCTGTNIHYTRGCSVFRT